MKFNIQVDISPEELRKVLGWPDLEPLHQEMLQRFREQLDAGSEGYDPASWLKPYMPGAIGTMDAWQKMLLGMMSQGMGRSEQDKES
ncbi:DUF6489 family protein [Balneatrix alpica]|uniref:DUF6489 family protein n=1 Tax=Balneatrix alpica TaxID=75684 RepID=UPI0027394B0E|nr:DUF6489 family protein [Balneatrix alpica]